MTSLGQAHIRIARPTDNATKLLPFYCDGLGFQQIGKFTDHDGFDGVMLGHPSACYHLEFTTKHGHTVGKAPSQDNLLVFYLPETETWRAAVNRMELAGFSAIPSFNPYWDIDGRTFEDADGYRVVLQNAAWKNAT